MLTSDDDDDDEEEEEENKRGRTRRRTMSRSPAASPGPGKVTRFQFNIVSTRCKARIIMYRQLVVYIKSQSEGFYFLLLMYCKSKLT